MSTVNEAFRQFYPSFYVSYPQGEQQKKAAFSLMNCRTSVLGGNAYTCHECGHVRVHYNSCCNRHCPLCQGISKAIWVDQRQKDILNAPYFHLVFTLPKELHTLIYQNQKLLYSLMYKAVSETLSELCLDPKYLGAQSGFFNVLHTWGQDLHYHPHIHTVIIAGGLTNLNQWKQGSKKFFIPVKVLAKKFRGKFMYYLKQYYRENMLDFYGHAKEFHNFEAFQGLIDQCYAKDWYVYCKRPFSGPLAVIEYLGRYTHQIAISNSRIVSVNLHTVTFKVRDNKGGKPKNLTLQGIEFVRRFLMHVLPKGFIKVRYYGVLATRNKKTKLSLCRKLTSSSSYKPKFEGKTTTEILSILFGKDITICPFCHQSKLKKIYSGASP